MSKSTKCKTGRRNSTHYLCPSILPFVLSVPLPLIQRPMWKHYYRGTDVLVLVVDSTDHYKVLEAKHDLCTLLKEKELRRAIFLVMANKQDLFEAASPDDIARELEVDQVKDRPIRECVMWERGRCGGCGRGEVRDGRFFFHPSPPPLLHGGLWVPSSTKRFVDNHRQREI